MSTILDRILETKRAEVAAKKATMSLASLEAMMARRDSPRGFKRALDKKAKSGPALIAEIKKASPSKGVIRAEFDPPAHARAYQKGGATCLSVLTDETYFQGDDSYLSQVHDAVPLPLLRKDFMIDPWQAHESRALGADAILIIVAALDDSRMAEIEAAAIDCRLDVLVEVHGQRELDRALRLKSRLIGVNNRDLRDFTVSFDRTYELVGKAPKDCTFVAESGLTSHTDLAAMREHGVKCFLVGESLMRADDIAAATRELLGAP
ncbi:indole-3-glycerol phosphate synthase TrpC [Sphingomonas sp.]|jgi:indole-3-glycerol phosphate synthase|uniref:indole-3-glycerol phosphate synthase TrpC n=1 Tax=Sphingomonas sp. TaxID=28214 RepID=UPI002E30EB53|nr:indole-3-glycerol phosphate synthase TrpC [Sphingomonas sp.]HEX4694013.1 indole-3-glycerol phosphate synthase TrpC [Sphingomonas sp.]